MTVEKSGGIARRTVLRRGALACAGVASSLLLPQGAFAGSIGRAAKPAEASAAAAASVLRWMSSTELDDFGSVCPGWHPASSAAVAQTCAIRLNDLVDSAPVRNWTGPQQVQLRLIGFDGVSPAADHALDVLYPADGLNTLLPFRLGSVSDNRMQGSPQSVRAWSWDGRVPLSISSGRARNEMAQLIDLPAEKGVYLIALADPSRWIDPAALAFAPAQGVLHRRLVDVFGNPLTDIGYFAISLDHYKV